ncbi:MULTISPECIES: hypothetical protein [unclassified Bradyrhizobium]|uniref:hypothetical protein n=1 Tax=unclassified Bradyrhizobium TaxID=2631580 RepID=UPI002478E0CB|nr:MULTISPECIES: hypothetical protein [unclassified Bradyrhizobium]WGR75369.1 hypothetical protein MTX24_08525 [Bradyrhizobium sp. ISRA426]WGR82996.1 hypothetical protein MTX21_33480 [Bradyrhizobium sp. ISRA430]WGR90573.1 hypothetical protein MTX25_08530 [Bradyrhizobium sp. ISRA432]
MERLGLLLRIANHRDDAGQHLERIRIAAEPHRAGAKVVAEFDRDVTKMIAADRAAKSRLRSEAPAWMKTGRHCGSPMQVSNNCLGESFQSSGQTCSDAETDQCPTDKQHKQIV